MSALAPWHELQNSALPFPPRADGPNTDGSCNFCRVSGQINHTCTARATEPTQFAVTVSSFRLVCRPWLAILLSREAFKAGPGSFISRDRSQYSVRVEQYISHFPSRSTSAGPAFLLSTRFIVRHRQPRYKNTRDRVEEPNCCLSTQVR